MTSFDRRSTAANQYSGNLRGEGVRVAIACGRFNDLITERLLAGARDGLLRHGVDEASITEAWVPGAFELPLAASRLASSGEYDAVICLGAVIRGDTAHFELVAAETARGIMDVTRATGVPVIFEVLATEDLAQAEARAGGAHGNKGWEAARAALEMAALLDAMPKESEP